jgi:hypothetical protein
MQTWWRDWALAELKAEPVPMDDPGDFGFYDEETFKRWFFEYQASHCHPGHLPRPGGILAQTRAVQHDLRVARQLLGFYRWDEVRKKKDQEAIGAMLGEDYTQ